MSWSTFLETKLATTISENKIAYSYSDLIQRVAKQAVYKAVRKDEPFSIALFEALGRVPPSPVIEE